jgi:hypothetical protein
MLIDFAHRLYRLGLLAYPESFRTRYAEEMARVFSEGLSEARRAGFGSTLRYYCRTWIDYFGSVARERIATMNRESGFAAFAAMICGCLAAYVDFHATEVQAILLIILLSGFTLGWAVPKRAWRWAVLIAVWLPATHMVVFALQKAEPAQRHPYFSRFMTLLPALVFALLGVYGGAFVRFMGRERGHHSDRGPAPER